MSFICPKFTFSSHFMSQNHPSIQPCNLRWKRVAPPSVYSLIRLIIAYLFFAAIVGVTYLSFNSGLSISFIAFILGCLDALYPIVFAHILTKLVYLDSIDDKKMHLQIQLFFARISLTCLFPFATIPYNSFLDKETLSSLVQIVMWSTYLAPIEDLFDIWGVFNR